MNATNPNLENVVTSDSDRSKANLAEVWQVVDTPVYAVVDEEGVNVAGGKARRLNQEIWLYVDDTDGYGLMAENEVENLLLVPWDKHTPYGWDRNGNVVEL